MADIIEVVMKVRLKVDQEQMSERYAQDIIHKTRKLFPDAKVDVINVDSRAVRTIQQLSQQG